MMSDRRAENQGLASGRADRAFDRVGGFVDRLFLTAPRLLKSRRNIDRDACARRISFYIDEGYADHPASFFDLPEDIPDYRVIEEQPYRDGRCQVIAYDSGYLPRNPMIREHYRRFTANRTAYLVRWTHGDRPRNTVLWLHGYLLGEPRQARRMFRVGRLFHMGLDAALFITPLHWRRAPKNPALRGMFLQPDDAAMTCECFGQAMHDLHLAFAVLKDSGAREIGVIGASLGGRNAALYVCLSDRPAFTAMMVPAVDIAKPLGPNPPKMNHPADKAFERMRDRVWRIHSPLTFMPRIPAARLLFVAARGDRLCPFEDVRALWEKWGRPRHRFLTGGHWLMLRPGERGRAWYTFLKDMDFY